MVNITNIPSWKGEVSDILYDVDTTATAGDMQVVTSGGVRTAKVYGTPVRLADHCEYLAVACPFCHMVHFHQPFRHPPPSPTCVVAAASTSCAVDAPTDGYATGGGDAHTKTAKTAPTSLEVPWETDRVALCRKGTYYIIGGHA